MKKCKSCLIDKPVSDYYVQNKKTGATFGKCKLCVKSNVTANRLKNIEYYRKYDRDRGNRQSPEYLKELRINYSNQYKAQTMINNFIRDGKLVRKPCEVCDTEESIHAHHDDYLEPLNVRWLCCAHHKQWHRDNGEGLNR
jgi:hypothetical protein